MTYKINRYKVNGMICLGCEQIITQVVKDLPGVRQVQASYENASLHIEYDDAVVDEAIIRQVVESKGYQIDKNLTSAINATKPWFIFLVLLIFVGGVALWGKSQMPGVMHLIKPHMGSALLFGIGLLTGFHCIGMCGGFVVGYTDTNQSKLRQLWAHLIYGFGKTFSYTTLGAGFGLLGATISITPEIRGITALIASLFLLVYGLKMLNVFTVLRRFSLRMPTVVNQQITKELHKRNSPLKTGLLTGLLLGCGPLQAMYVMAAGTGDAFQGAMVLLMFGLGTLIPLLGFGFFASSLPSAFMSQLVYVSGILVIVMGLMMAERGWKMLHAGQLQKAQPQSFQQNP